FVERFAVPLPVTVIADQLGVSRDDLADFKRWSDDSVAPLGGMITRERQLECARSLVEFQTYFAQRIEERRANPQDDILSALVNAHLDVEAEADGSDTRPLDVPEMLSILNQILVAGNETTTNLLASAMLLLLQHPDQMRIVRDDPDAIEGLLEEALRLESPVQGLFRVATSDTELDGVPTPAGSRLVLMYASGNRDDAQFPAAANFDVCRADAKMHLAFGGGEHFCLGAALARLEARVAFEELLRRTTDIQLADEQGEFPHTPSFILRGLQELRVRIVPA
ncbi:MAG TPA: cytochrome P450, partial [Dehalococcoidia bacterium]|nr:cytochrome P450 [Dehalococcoidia bacterium]